MTVSAQRIGLSLDVCCSWTKLFCIFLLLLSCFSAENYALAECSGALFFLASFLHKYRENNCLNYIFVCGNDRFFILFCWLLVSEAALSIMHSFIAFDLSDKPAFCSRYCHLHVERFILVFTQCLIFCMSDLCLSSESSPCVSVLQSIFPFFIRIQRIILVLRFVFYAELMATRICKVNSYFIETAVSGLAWNVQFVDNADQ